MIKLLTAALLAFGMFAGHAALAEEKTIVLSVENMTCAACPYIVKKRLAAVEGVNSVAVSFESKTATVIYDDGEVAVAALIAATTEAGYPSTPRN